MPLIAGAKGYDQEGMPATSSRMSSPWGCVRAAERMALWQRSAVCARDRVARGGYRQALSPWTPLVLRVTVLARARRIAVDRRGVVYVTETSGARLRTFTVGGEIWTLAGTGVSGFNGDGIAGLAAQLNLPQGVVVDERFGGRAPTSFVADATNARVRRLTTRVPDAA